MFKRIDTCIGSYTLYIFIIEIKKIVALFLLSQCGESLNYYFK